MLSQYELRVLSLWAGAIVATALIAGPDVSLPLGSVFFICMVGSLMVLSQAWKRRVEWIFLLFWAGATVAMLFITADSSKSNVLGPLYFVCMVASIYTARQAYRAA